MRNRIKKISVILILLFMVWYYFAIPDPLFNVSYTTVVEDHNGELLGALIADDEQWRFPQSSIVPDDYKNALLAFEDDYFYHHPGVNPLSLFKALVVNVKEGSVKRGGSTITMQVVRLSRGNPSRTVVEKIYEILLATRLELSYTKEEILASYAAHAPFGGNVVGLEAACWRYFNRPPDDLTISEYATLAVLPNNPALIHPGRNRTELLKKRNKLLDKLLENGVYDSVTVKLAKLEELPEEPNNIPQWAPHVRDQFHSTNKGKRTITNLDLELQKRAMNAVARFQENQIANGVYNMGLIITEIESGKVVAYVGNGVITPKDQGGFVDVVRAPRSTGSILKPFLFGASLDEGLILKNSLIADIPIYHKGFHPKNYNNTYDGAVPASLALSRSLNVPMVILLKEYGVEKFRAKLQNWGLNSIDKDSDYYGLSLILGGAESSLWELTSAYRKLMHSAVYPEEGLTQMRLVESNSNIESIPISPSSAFQTLMVMRNLIRPGSESGWRTFGGRNISWKTGTSFGNRDAWAIGVNSEYAVGVWVGNANGEGRPVLTGVDAAAPILFEVFSWFDKPSSFELEHFYFDNAEICSESGMLANEYCTNVQTELISKVDKDRPQCNFHKQIFIDRNTGYRLMADCRESNQMDKDTVFVLNGIMEWYYKNRHMEYKGMPPWDPKCSHQDSEGVIQVIYPGENQVIIPTRDMNGELSKVIFRAAHQHRESKVYWHIDDAFVGSTQHFHELALNLTSGFHVLYLVDEDGNETHRNFEVTYSPN